MTEEIVTAIADKIARQFMSGLGIAPKEGVVRESSYVTKQTAAEMLDCTVRTIERYIEAGELEKFKRGRHTVVLRWQLERLVKSHGPADC